MDEIRDFLRSRSVANLTIVIINVAVFLILSCFGDTENADFMAAHGASYTPYIVQDGKYYLLITSMFLHFGLSHLFNNMVVLMYSIRITVNSIRNDGTTRKDPGNGGKPRKIKGFSELMKRGGTRIDTFFEKRAHFSEQKEKLSTLSTKRAGKPHKQRVPGSF